MNPGRPGIFLQIWHSIQAKHINTYSSSFLAKDSPISEKKLEGPPKTRWEKPRHKIGQKGLKNRNKLFEVSKPGEKEFK